MSNPSQLYYKLPSLLQLELLLHHQVLIRITACHYHTQLSRCTMSDGVSTTGTDRRRQRPLQTCQTALLCGRVATMQQDAGRRFL